MAQRQVNIHADGPAVDRGEVARILAYYITGGDPAGYLARLAEKQQQEAESLKVK